jgi:hypothetical protein
MLWVSSKKSIVAKQAQEIAITMNNNPRRRQAKAKAYDCPWCDDWHVGHDNKLVPLWETEKI